MKKGKYDIELFCATLFLVALGLIMVTSASQIIAHERFRSPFFFLQKHAILIGLGLCILLVFMRIPFKLYQRFSILILIVSIILLAALFPWGRKIRGANRWLLFPYLNFMLQPVEVAKLALIIFLTSRIASYGRKYANDFKKGFFPLVAVTICIAVMVALQPNISNAAFIVVLSFVLLFVGGCRLLYLLPYGVAVTAAAAAAFYRFSHVQGRIFAYLSGGQDIRGLNWHVDQSLIALGSGFIFGCGPGRGHQKYNFLPDAHTDFIYSIIGEELGAFGTLLVLVLFAFIFARAVRTARRAPDSFGYMLAVGIGITIFGTALINMAMTLGIIPVAGLPLPFISYGGSSLLTSMAAVGILLNISSMGRERNRPMEKLAGRNLKRRVYARRVINRKKA